MKMKEKDLIKDIARQTRLSEVATKKILRAFTTSVAKALREGENVPLTGLGTFSISKRKARTGRNPQTMEEIKIPEKKVPKFKASLKLKNHVD